MKTDRKIKYVVVMALVVAVLGISVAFAAMNQTLNINGVANFNPATWNVKFANLSSPIINGSANVNVAPVLTETRIGDFVVNFSQPNDMVTYTFSVRNEGTMNASLSTFTMAAPTCVGSSEITGVNDASLVCSNLNFTLTYEDGSIINNGDSLPAGSEKRLKLSIGYNGGTLPSAPVNIKGLDVSFIYTQS